MKFSDTLETESSGSPVKTILSKKNVRAAKILVTSYNLGTIIAMFPILIIINS